MTLVCARFTQVNIKLNITVVEIVFHCIAQPDESQLRREDTDIVRVSGSSIRIVRKLRVVGMSVVNFLFDRPLHGFEISSDIS